MKKISLILAVCILLATSSHTAFAAYENTYVNTGNQIEDIIGVAMTQDGNTDGTKYNNPKNNSWCAYFIIWCARQAGIDSSIIKNTGYATSDDLLGSGRYYDKSTDYKPKRGDIIVYDWVSNGLCKKTPRSFYGDHVGIVTSVDNTYVYTVEGNRSGMVKTVKTSLTSENIKGYGSPNYKASNVTPSNPGATPAVCPGAPTNINAVKSGKTAAVSWKAGAYATSYEVEWYSQSKSVWKSDTDYKNKTALSYTTTGLVNDSTKYRIRSVNNGEKSEWVEFYVKSSSTPTNSGSSTSYKLDGYDCNKIEKNMTVNVGAGSTLRFARAVSATSNDYTAISNGKTVYVYGVTVNKYPNKSGTNINWAKIKYDGKEGWVNYAYLK